MKNLWKKDFYAEKDINTAQEILQEQCDYLMNNTRGKIIAKVAEYDGPTQSYTEKSTFSSISETLKDQFVNIQTALGETSSNKFAYEFYITSSATPNYKYRIMFMTYGITFYPVNITLDESIASEIHQDQYIICETQEQLENILEQILNSSQLEKIINNLLAIAKQQDGISW